MDVSGPEVLQDVSIHEVATWQSKRAVAQVGLVMRNRGCHRFGLHSFSRSSK